MERAERLIVQLLPNVDVDKAIGPMPELPSESKKEGDEASAEDGHATNQASSSSYTRDMSKRSSMHSHPHQEASDISRSSAGWDACGQHDDQGSEADEEEDAAFIRIQMENVNLMGESETMLASFKNRQGSKVYDLRDFEQDPLDQVNDRDSQAPLLYYGHASGVHLFPALHRLARNDDDGGSLPAPSPATSSAAGPSYEDAGLPNEPELDWSAIQFRWPTEAMQAKLLDIYFRRANPHFPVLNEVVFRKRLQQADWKTDDREACILSLGVFSLATRFVTEDEERLYAPILAMADRWSTLQYVLLLRNVIPIGSSLDYIQSVLLLLVYHHSTPQPRTTITWLFLGGVIRLLVDMGAHRKFTAAYSNFDLVTEETYRRCFWVAYVLDKTDSADMGRPIALQDEDIDLDDMLLVDDEYLVQANEQRTPAVQPDDRPSRYHGFHQMVQLSRIIGRTLRTIYAISKSKAARGFVGKKWDAYIVAEIDKSLNKWLEHVPPHLSYSPMESNQEWLIQSSRLFLMYYHVQALVHRPFVQRYKFDSPQTFHSLAIVSNASRSAIHVAHNLVNRGLTSLIGFEAHLRILIFGCYLLLISYSAKQKDFSVSSAMVEDTRKATEALHAMQGTWRMSAKMAVHLDKLLARLYPPYSPSSSSGKHEVNAQKRAFDVQSNAPSAPPNVPGQVPAQREIRGLRQSSGNSNVMLREANASSRLPISTSELEGRFKDSPPSAFDQVAALSGWSQGGLGPFVGADAAAMFGQQGNAALNMNGTFPSDASLFASTMGMAGMNSNFNMYNANGTTGTQDFVSNAVPVSFSMSGNVANVTAPISGVDPLRNDTFLSAALPTPSLDVSASAPQSSYINSTAANLASPRNVANTSMQADASWPSFLNAQNPTSSNDPLDALSSLNGFWSDSDWMRALQNTQA
jgi:hypothetical protein